MEDSLDRALGLPLTCRKLRGETELLPYKLATFYFEGFFACRFRRYGQNKEQNVYQQQRAALRSFLENRSEQQIEVLSKLGFGTYSQVRTKYAEKMGTGLYWVEELSCDGPPS